MLLLQGFGRCDRELQRVCFRLTLGLAALLLQLRLRPDLASSIRGPLWLNLLGVSFALGAVFADFLHLNAALMLIAALAAVVSFGVSGIILLSALRKPRV